MKNTKIIAAFPGTGKTHFFNSHSDCLDSDSSHYSWIKDEHGNNTKERNPNFIRDYMNHITENIGKFKYIFVSSHAEIRKGLVDNGYEFTLVYPNILLKEEYLKRFIQRGSPEGFVNLLNSKWDEWITECTNQENCKKEELQIGEFISDVIERV